MSIRDDVRLVHLSAFPQEEAVLRPFLHGFDVTWGRRRRAQNTELSVYFLKPHPHIQEAFGFEQELLLAYSPFPTLEPRAIQAAEQILHDDPARGRVERLTYLLVSDMPGARRWVQDYVSTNQETRLIAAFSSEELIQRAGDAWFVRNQLAGQFYGRDLFDFRLPLEHDTYFFGRDAEVLAYREAIRRGENRGLFGLRKTGKTSLLFKVERVLRSDELADVIYVDCKSPSIRTLRWYELIDYLSSKMPGTRKQEANLKGASPATISDHFNHCVHKSTSNKRLVLIFDEIEYISPLAVLDLHWRQDFVAFWQTIWSCQSRHRGMTAILAGVNPTVTEESVYEGVQNPLFGIVSSQYLKGLNLADTRRMLRTLGKRMGLNFAADAVDYLQHRYGGHPYLTRIACSFINTSLVKEKANRPVDVTHTMLVGDELVRDSDLSFYCEHVVSELRQFYEHEYQMLELLAGRHIADFVELARDGSEVKHLRDYGLLGEKMGLPAIIVPVIERYVAGRARGSSTVPTQYRNKWASDRITHIIDDLRALERRIEVKQQQQLFGPNSFSEADKLAALKAVNDNQGFEHFINVMNRCLVESIERFGQHDGKQNYFWELKDSYPALHLALERIKVYRHNSMHLYLKPQFEEKLASFLKHDLQDKRPNEVADFWFVLQQRVLDNLFAAIQIESSRLG